MANISLLTNRCAFQTASRKLPGSPFVEVPCPRGEIVETTMIGSVEMKMKISFCRPMLFLILIWCEDVWLGLLKLQGV